MRSLFTLTLIAIFMVAAFMERFHGLLLYWWFAIFRPQDWIWWDVSSLRLPLMVAALFIIPCFFQGIWPRLKDSTSILIGLFLFFALYAYFTVGCGPIGDKQMEHFVKVILIILLTDRIVNTKKQLFLLIVTVGFSLCYHSADFGIYSLMQGGSVLYDNASLTGTFSGSNAFALGTATLIFFMFFAVQGLNLASLDITPNWSKEGIGKKALQAIGFVLIIGSIYLVISIFSRGSALAMACGMLLWVLLQQNRIKLIMIGIPVLIIGLLVAPLPEGYAERMQTVFAEDEERDNSAESRPHFWNTALLMLDTYSMGVGPGCFKAYYDEFDITQGSYGSMRSVHSSHFQIISEIGYMGIIIWVSLIVVTYWKLWAVRKKALKEKVFDDTQKYYLGLSNAFLCALTTFWLGGSFYELAHAEIIWLIFIVAVIAKRLQENEGNSEIEIDTLDKNEN